jgi:hypothetical protein
MMIGAQMFLAIHRALFGRPEHLNARSATGITVPHRIPRLIACTRLTGNQSRVLPNPSFSRASLSGTESLAGPCSEQKLSNTFGKILLRVLMAKKTSEANRGPDSKAPSPKE